MRSNVVLPYQEMDEMSDYDMIDLQETGVTYPYGKSNARIGQHGSPGSED